MLKYIRTIGLLCLSLSTAFAAAPLQSKRYFQNSGGMVDHISPILVPDNKASGMVNFTVDDRGQLTARAGFKILNSTGNLGGTSVPVTGGGYHNAASGTSFFAIIVGTNVYRTSNSFGGTYTRVTSTVTLTSSASNLAQHTSLNDYQIFCNELDPPFKLNASTDAIQLGVGSPTKAHTCATYGSYLVLANLTESAVDYPSRIRWSDISNQDVWPALNYIDIEPNDGDKIVSVIAYQDSVYVFKKRSIYKMMITGLDGPDAFIVRPYARNLGAWAKNSVRVIPNLGIAFLAQNTLYILGDTQFEAVGDPIQRTFDSVTRSQWANAVGAVYPKRYQYVLAVSTTGATNNISLVYDYVQKSWTTYSGISFGMLEQAEDVTGQNVLVTGDYHGNNYKLDEATNKDLPDNVSTAITTSYTTGWLHQDMPEFTKSYKYVYIFTQVTSTASLTIEASFDYGTTYEYHQTVGLGTATALYGTAIYGIDLYALSGYDVTRFEINRSAKAIKLRFSSSSTAASINPIGWALIYSDEDWKD